MRALDRTQPLLPMRPGQAERRTHDYKRHGTTTLLAALNIRTATLVTAFHRRHRSVEFRRFLDGGSWLNSVERRFAELTNQQLRRGVHRGVAQVEAAIRELIDAHHAKPKPFVWTKTADQILESVARFAQRTLDFHAAPIIARTTRSGH